MYVQQAEKSLQSKRGHIDERADDEEIPTQPDVRATHYTLT